MYRIAVVEDDAGEQQKITDCLHYLEQTEGYAFEISVFSSGISFILNYEPVYDLVFMDIQMPGMDGLETARKLRQMDTDVTLVFVTNMAQYALVGYEVEAIDFILKPVNRLSFAMKVKRAIARTVLKHGDNIMIKSDGENQSVQVDDITYLEVAGHQVLFHTMGKTYAEYMTLKEACERINRNYFAYCNRSYLVNMKHVKSVNREEVVVGATRLTISRPKHKEFLAAISEYMRGRK